MDWSTVYGDSNCGFKFDNGSDVVLLDKARTCSQQLLLLDCNVEKILLCKVKHEEAPKWIGRWPNV